MHIFVLKNCIYVSISVCLPVFLSIRQSRITNKHILDYCTHSMGTFVLLGTPYGVCPIIYQNYLCNLLVAMPDFSFLPKLVLDKSVHFNMSVNVQNTTNAIHNYS